MKRIKLGDFPTDGSTTSEDDFVSSKGQKTPFSQIITFLTDLFPSNFVFNSVVNTKVDKITGKGLSTNDYDNLDKAKVGSTTLAGHGIADAYTKAETQSLIALGELPALPTTTPTNTNIVYVPTTLNVAYSHFNGLTPTKVYSRFIYNGSAWTLVEGDIDLSGVYTKPAIDLIIGNPIIQEYPLDFTTLTTLSAVVATYILNKPLTVGGKLNSMRVKVPVGSTVTPYAYSITGSNGSLATTLLHTYPSFVTTSLEHTQQISDAFVLATGQFIGFRSSLGEYYSSTSGNNSLVVGTTTWSITNIAYDFTVDTNITNGVLQRVSTLEDQAASTYTKLQIDAQIGTPSLRSYVVDYSAYSLTGGANGTYIRNLPVLFDGVLSSIRVKTVIGSTVTPYIYSLTGSSGSYVFTLIHTFPSFVTDALNKTYYILDTFVVQAGQYIGLKSTGNYYYSTGLPNSTALPNSTTWTSTSVSYDFVINENTSSGLTGRTSSLESRVTANENSISNTVSKSYLIDYSTASLKPAFLYQNNLTSLSDFTEVGWSLSSPGAVPTATGASNSLWLQKRYHVNPRMLNVDITLLGDSVFYIDLTLLSGAQGDGVFAVDVPNNSLKIYNRSNGGTPALAQVANGVIPFTIVASRKYVLTVSIIDWLNIFIIKDTVTGESYEVDYLITTSSLLYENRQMDSYKFYLNSGTTSGVKIWKMSILSKKNPFVWLGGDSITEGDLFSNATFNNRYPVLLRTALRGSVIISARGGASLTDINDAVATELPFIKPDYAMLTIGTNSSFTNGALTTTVNNIIALGITPIINHVPNRADGSHIATNSIIDAVCNSVSGAIRGCLFDVATSIGGDPANSYVVANYWDGGVHPNVAGQLEMFKRFAIDLPFLFA